MFTVPLECEPDTERAPGVRPWDGRPVTEWASAGRLLRSTGERPAASPPPALVLDQIAVDGDLVDRGVPVVGLQRDLLEPGEEAELDPLVAAVAWPSRSCQRSPWWAAEPQELPVDLQRTPASTAPADNRTASAPAAAPISGAVVVLCTPPAMLVQTPPLPSLPAPRCSAHLRRRCNQPPSFSRIRRCCNPLVAGSAVRVGGVDLDAR